MTNRQGIGASQKMPCLLHLIKLASDDPEAEVVLPGLHVQIDESQWIERGF
jgi:hypothetical protein